ncbi:hypothetical protein [Taibaiella chishuiensis]|uniref:TolB-like protein n=1 Tax=Taibaiella chishuiensis TaxID=1434707 RepID=A0A2P8D8L0_9BACT|nr:hypothetical protein [Taibaiella chishuiensis]PSK93549.1 hypothetical protein B0I18_102519 [Taibaiella chishuiensis]
MQRLVLAVLLFTLIACSRTPAGSDRLVIALDPAEGVSCIKNMELLHANANIPPITFVFAAQYRKDSAEIIRSLSLRDYDATYTWSDSLFHLRSMQGHSALNLVSSNGDTRFRKQLKLFTQEDVINLQRHRAPVSDTLLLPEQVAHNAYETMLTDGSRLYFCDAQKKKIDVVSLPDGKYQKTFTVGRQDVEAAFDLALGKGAYALHKKALASLNTPDQEVLQYCSLSGNGLVAVAAYACLAAAGGADTAVTRFYAVHTFGDSAVGTMVFPGMPLLHKTFLQDPGEQIRCVPAVHYYKGACFAGIRKADTVKSLHGNRFLAKLSPEQGRLRFLEIFDYPMPDIYRNDDHALPLFDKAYCMLPLASKMYSLEGQAPVDIRGLTFNAGPDLPAPPDKYIAEFRTGADQVTLIYYVTAQRQYHLLRYDLKKGLILFDQIIPSGTQKPVIDPKDNNYVYYRVKDNLVVRQHHRFF